MRRVIAALVVVGLAVGVALLWPRSDPDDTPDTVAAATTTTSTTIAETTTTRGNASSTTFDDGTQVVETVEEAEAVLRELWFGWFEGIYNQDEDRIREVVATEQFLEAGASAFNELPFISEPSVQGISFEELDILRSTGDCLAVWSVSTTEFLDVSEPRSGVEVLRFVDGWKFASAWRLRGDLWEEDCEAELSPLD